ncbi:MAG: OmpP1/FadL family transporter, partial [Acidobacteriota bacterium]
KGGRMRRFWLAMFGSVMFATPLAAQSNVEVNAGLQLDFLTPGARSLAMGSAFIGVADDATAVSANPAGLRALSRREVSVELRGRGLNFPVVTGGRASGTATGTGIDTLTSLTEIDQSLNAKGLSFLSFVYPRSRWAIAGYRHELANLDASVTTGGFFFTPRTGGNVRRLPIKGSMDLDIVTYGVSGSVNLTSQLSIGAGLAFHDFKMASRTDRFGINNAAFSTPVFFGAANYDTGNLLNYQLQEGEGTDASVNVGLIWAPSRKFQVGAVFRQGPDFDLRVANINPMTNQPFANRDLQGAFHVPHVIGVGGVFRPMANTTFAVDVTKVEYSRLAKDFIDIFNDAADAESFTVQNGTEFHAGFEHVFPRRIPVALRAGYWFDPEHALEIQGAPDISQVYVFRRRDEDQHHLTFGGGVVIGNFEINAAGDVSHRTKIGALSAVVRF